MLMIARQSSHCLCSSFNNCRASVNVVFPSRLQYLSGLECSGTESSLLECAYDSPLGTVCSSGEGVRVTCSIHNGTVVSGPDESEGEGEQCTHELL